MSIIVDKVNYVYSQGTAYEIQALKNINLKIEDGEFIGIIGHTGSGKSTLIQHLNGLTKATSGAIYYNGADIYDEGYNLKELRSKVGLVFQYPEHQLFETTIFEDVCFGPKNQGLTKEEAELRAFAALKSVGLPEEVYYHSPFDLSGGQKRRVAIAGVLAMQPEVLILDEPTAGLDPKGRDEILDQVAKLHKERGITVILVSHSMEDVAKYVDRIIVMNQGSVMFDDIPKSVFAHYKELEAVGLAAPQVTYLMHELAAAGISVSMDDNMLRDITIGQYYPADSVIHKLDPRVKLFATLIFIISLFSFKNVWGFLVATIFMFGFIELSKVPIGYMVKGLKAIVILMIITALFNLFLTSGKELVSFWIFTITYEGLRNAILMAIRLTYLILGTSVMTLTTTPNELTDGLEKALAPMNKIHVPVHEIAMMMSIALRFIPILVEETDKIMRAQMARGADFETGGVIQRAKNMIPLLVPLFVSAFRRANDLAMAMEARCYRGGAGRTKMKPLKYASIDYRAYVIVILYFVIMMVLRFAL